MNQFTLTEIKRAIKKFEIMIDKIVDLQDMGFGDARLQEIQDRVQIQLNKYYSEEGRRYGECDY